MVIVKRTAIPCAGHDRHLPGSLELIFLLLSTVCVEVMLGITELSPDSAGLFSFPENVCSVAAANEEEAPAELEATAVTRGEWQALAALE